MTVFSFLKVNSQKEVDSVFGHPLTGVITKPIAIYFLNEIYLFINDYITKKLLLKKLHFFCTEPPDPLLKCAQPRSAGGLFSLKKNRFQCQMPFVLHTNRRTPKGDQSKSHGLRSIEINQSKTKRALTDTGAALLSHPTGSGEDAENNYSQLQRKTAAHRNHER